MLSLRGGGIVPTALRLSRKSCSQLLDEEALDPGTQGEPARVLEELIGLRVELTEEQTDVIVAKELFPERCPQCGEHVAAVPVLLNRVERQGFIRCSSGHVYEPEVHILYLNVFQQHSAPIKRQELDVCPECGGKNVQHLSDTDAFCLDCEWDNMKRRV